MADVDTVESVRAEAVALYNECRRKLDDASYVFRDGTGENWVKQLEDCANRCRVAGLESERRDLLSCVEEVKARTESW